MATLIVQHLKKHSSASAGIQGSTKQTGKKCYWLEEGKEMRDARDEGPSAIGDGRRAAILHVRLQCEARLLRLKFSTWRFVCRRLIEIWTVNMFDSCNLYFCCIFKCLTYPYTHPTLGLLYLQFPLPRMFFLQLSTGFPPSLYSEFAQMPHYQGHCLGYSKWNCIHPPPSLFLSSCCATHLMVCFFVQQNIISLYGLDVLCPSRIHMLKPTAQCDGVRRWGPLGGG